MRRRISVLTILLAVSAAQAQDNPLVGNWLSTFIDPRGITNSATAVAVQPNGLMAMTLSVSGSGGSGRQMLTLAYRMTGENSYMTRVVDYGPKQMCGAGVCLPVPPMAPLGTTSSCQFTITDNIILTVSCDGQQPIRYTRQ